MTKEITKAVILQELQDKFKLREFLPANFLFDETVVPVYDISPHLINWDVIEKTVSITTGPAAALFFTVPANERWLIRAFNVIFVTGTYTVTGVLYNRATVADYMYLDMEIGRSVSYAFNLPTVLTLNPGDQIKVYIDNYTSTGNLMLHMDMAREEIR